MPHYVSLINWTDQGTKTVKESPKRIETLAKAIEGAGGRLLQALYTMGPHDIVLVAEFPSDELANRIILQALGSGNAHSVTLKGWTREEFAKLAQQL